MLAQGQLPSTETTIVVLDTSTGTSVVQVKSMFFFNTSTSKRDMNIWVVPNNSGSLGSPNISNKFYKYTMEPGENIEIAPSYPLELDEDQDAIFANSNTDNTINFFFTGVRK